MSAVGEFMEGLKRGWRRAMGDPKPDPWVSNMISTMELQWKIAANKRYRRYKADLQKRGRLARDGKARKLITERTA